MLFLNGYIKSPFLGTDIHFSFCIEQCHISITKSSCWLCIVEYSFAVMANKGGRPQDPVWEHFVRVTNEGKLLARCVSCGSVKLRIFFIIESNGK